MINVPRKKVLFLITKSNWGGAQRYVFDLATNLDQNRFEPVVALGGDGELTTRLKNAGIPVILIHSLRRDISLETEWAFVQELASILRTERPDILHVNSSKAGGVGTFLGRLYRIPRIIFTAHGWAFNEDRPVWQKLLIKVLHYITILLSHRTIMVSKSLLTQLSWPGVANRAKILHPGRNIGAMYEKAEARERLLELIPATAGISSDKTAFWIGTIGELHPIKRHQILLEALPAILESQPNSCLCIIGEGGERAHLEATIAELNLQTNAFLLGNISEAARLLRAFDLFVLPSKSESYGYVAHEAGLAEVPVIATNVGGIPEIIMHEVSGLLVPPDATAELSNAVTTLLQEPEKRARFASALHDAMTTRSVEAMVRATETLYTL